MSANERRAEIIRVLVGRRSETMRNLAFQFGVSLRTINYDILALTAEYPLETMRGNGGCVKLADGYYTYKNLFSHEQQNVLISLMDKADESQSKVLCELLHAYGSKNNQQKISERGN